MEFPRAWPCWVQQLHCVLGDPPPWELDFLTAKKKMWFSNFAPKGKLQNVIFPSFPGRRLSNTPRAQRGNTPSMPCSTELLNSWKIPE